MNWRWMTTEARNIRFTNGHVHTCIKNKVDTSLSWETVNIRKYLTSEYPLTNQNQAFQCLNNPDGKYHTSCSPYAFSNPF